MGSGTDRGTGRPLRPRLTRLAAAGSALAAAVAISAGGGGLAAAGAAPAAGVNPGSPMALMRAAASEFHVPAGLLLAISWNQTRWVRPGGSPSIDGGYGPMDLTARTFPAQDWRGVAGRPLPRSISLGRAHDTLPEAAHLLHLPAAVLRTSDRQNIRGAAALLAHYARRLSGGSLPATVGGWYGAVAEFSGDRYAQTAQSFADGVYATLAHGASLTTPDRQLMTLPAAPGVRPDRAQLAQLHLRHAPAAGGVACPPSLRCRFVPAAYHQNNPHDPGNYGNYDTAGRPSRMRTPAGRTVPMKIRYLIIHDTEGSYSSAISTFQNPRSYVSANYVIRSADGAVTEMVRPRNVAWGAGDWYINMHAISIENEGFAAQGRTWYTQAMYRSDAALVRYLAAKYHIPLNRQHILGHEDVPGPTDALTAAQHWDPGPFWNWNHFMALVHRVSDATEQARGGSLTRGSHHLVTIDPTWSANQPPVSGLPAQPASFVYLRTGPGPGRPLLGDPVLHPGGGHGTTAASDWGDKATAGETFGYAGRSGNWTAIWFSGRKAWFWNPPGAGQAARYRGGTVITPRPGLMSIRVYGAAYPEVAAYRGTAVPVLRVTALGYRIRAGQDYPTAGPVPTDFYYAATINSSLPDDHTLVIGRTGYYQISFSHRKFFVRASDVTVRTLG